MSINKVDLTKAIRDLSAALETGHYSAEKQQLLLLLHKLGIKQAEKQFMTLGQALKIESLSATLSKLKF